MIHDAYKKLRYTYSFLAKKIVHVNLQLLYDCNFKCRICDFWRDPVYKKDSLSIEQIKVIEKKLREIGPNVISIGGGEPLLYDNIIDEVKIFSNKSFPVMICNGWFVTPQIAKELFKAGMYEVSISVDYAKAERHDAQRGMKGAFDKAICALQTLNENRVYPHQRVHMISVVMDDNIDDIEELIKISRDLEITYLLTLYSDNRGKKERRYTNKDVSSHLLSLKKKYKEFVTIKGYIGRFSEAIENGGISPCYAGVNLINIDTSGNVGFCIDDLDNYAGNIFTDDIKDIQKKLVLQKQNISCNGCWTSCRGSIETLMHGKNKFKSLLDYYQMTKDIKIRS